MSGFIDSSATVPTPRVRFPLGLILLALVCSISLAIVVDALVIHKVASPFLIQVSDVYRDRAVVNVMAPGMAKLCVVAYSIKGFDVRMVCESSSQTANGLYRFTLNGLRRGKEYQLLVGEGNHWWVKYDKYSRTSYGEKRLIPSWMPVIKTLSKDINTAPNTTVHITGSILGRSDAPKSDSLMIGTMGKRDVSFSTIGQVNGSFSLTIPLEYVPVVDAKPSDDELTVFVFTENQFAGVAYTLSQVGDKEQKITLEDL